MFSPAKAKNRRCPTNISSAGAKSYYRSAAEAGSDPVQRKPGNDGRHFDHALKAKPWTRHYSTADYYTEGQELAGQWRGEGAHRLGLSGEVKQSDWEALCDNLDPRTGERLTLRQKAERRVGYDFNWHAPKSVSLLYSLTSDDRLLDAFRESVDDTMRDMEVEMKTRVRKAGKTEDRITGNMVCGEFIHFTARPVDGVPDPHLHAHYFVFNTTYDHHEQVWKAGQFGDLKRDASYFEAKFHARLAWHLGELGLPIERTRTGWEIAGIDRGTLDRFSRRTALIEEEARRQGVLDPAAKSELGAKTRKRKQKNLTLDELRAEWTGRLSDTERSTLDRLANQIGGDALPEETGSTRDAITQAADHVFERRSVVPERTLLAESLKRAVGRSSAEAVEQDFQKQDFVIAERGGRRMATTREVLSEEQRMIAFARNGRGTEARLGRSDHVVTREWLNAGQRRAVEHVLTSRDRVILVRGAAGVGKTTIMQETVEGIESGGQRVFTFAPSAGAKSVLQKEGFENAETVARLLVDTQLQEESKGQVLWIDEAGLLGTRTLGKVFELARQQDCRVILSGDRRQHGSVERGAALSLLEREAGLVPAEIREIQRQSGRYKQAVQSLADGRTEEAFQELDRLGWISEVPTAERYRQLAADYVDSVSHGLETLVVAPTNAERERVSVEVRGELQKQGRLGTDERQFLMLTNTNFTETERADRVHYQDGDVLVFHQNAKGYRKSQRVEAGNEPLPLNQAARFQVFQAREITLAPGDILRVTRNGKTRDGQHRLDNGSLYRLSGFDDRGDLVLSNGWTIPKDYGHLDWGYCVTSHGSQGKTVDRVLIGESAESYAAASREQFYVSCSRGRKSVAVYTDDKSALLEAVCRSDDRLTATELVTSRGQRGESIRRQQRFLMSEPAGKAPHRERELAYER